MDHTDVLEHFLKEPAALRTGDTSPKVFLVRKLDNYWLSRCFFLKHDVILAAESNGRYYACAKDVEGWKPVLSASTPYHLVNIQLLKQLGSSAKRNAKLFFPNAFPRILLENGEASCFDCFETDRIKWRYGSKLERLCNGCHHRRGARDDSDEEAEEAVEAGVVSKPDSQAGRNLHAAILCTGANYHATSSLLARAGIHVPGNSKSSFYRFQSKFAVWVAELRNSVLKAQLKELRGQSVQISIDGRWSHRRQAMAGTVTAFWFPTEGGPKVLDLQHCGMFSTGLTGLTGLPQHLPQHFSPEQECRC